MSAQTDEAIRGLVYSVPYRKVHDLREAFAQGTMRALNKILLDYGVMIKSVKVTDVRLPKDLQETLENTTSFKTKMLEQEKKHENDMRVLANNEKQELTQIEKQNERAQQMLRAKLNRMEIEREESKANATSKASVSQTDAEANATVLIAQAESNKSVAEAQGLRSKEELLGRVKMECEARLVEARQKASSRIEASKARVEAFKAKAEALLEQGKLEGEHAADYEELRQFEYEQQRLRVMAKLAESKKMVISGKQGASLIDNLCPGTAWDMLKPRVASIDASRP